MMDKYKDLTREQLEAELDHRQQMIDKLGQALSQVQIQNVSLQLQVETQQNQMMAYVEKGGETNV